MRPQLLQYFGASLPVPRDEPYRLRQTTYTWHTFIPHRRMDRRTDRYCLGKTRVSYNEERSKRTETSKRMKHTKFAYITTCFYILLHTVHRCASGCVVECRICNREVAGSNLSLGYFAPRSTQPSIPLGSVNEHQLRLGKQRQVWLIPIAD